MDKNVLKIAGALALYLAYQAQQTAEGQSSASPAKTQAETSRNIYGAAGVALLYYGCK